LQHGTAKLLHVPHLAMFDQLHVVSLDGLAGMLEIVGGLDAVILGTPRVAALEVGLKF